jgi:thioesterase domain-containing protein/NAD(P)-dependent dehydrogenase (short-subunit alcohol dehydrogenase family)
LLDDTSVAARLAARLQERGAAVVRVSRPQELTLPCDGVICLGALDADGFPDQPERALEAACKPVLELVQAAPVTPLLVLVTRGAQRALSGDRLLSPFQAALWGLGRSIAVERPELATLLIDADPARPARTADEILDAIMSSGREGQLAYRDGARLVARLERARIARDELPRLRSEGCYLITGGLGALGLHAARELASAGARDIALLARREPNDEQRAQLAALEAGGVRMQLLRGDVADRAELEAALSSLSMPLRGVIHTAGVLDDALLGQQTWESFRRVLSAKVLGALQLRALTRRLSLDFTVHYSSTAGLFGAAGQANYAAANACLDALAALERGEGRRTSSVAFGAWRGSGMAARQVGTSQGAFGALTPDEGRAALRHVLRSAGSGASTLAFTKLRAHRLSRALGPGRPTWLDGLVGSADGSANPLRAELAALAPDARQHRIGELLRVELRRALGLAHDEPLPGDAELTSLGVDSLLAIQVPQLLGGLFGLSFGSTLLRDHPTLDALGRHIAQGLSPHAEPASAPSVLVLKRAAQRSPLVCLGGAPGDALYLGALARHLPPEQPLYALEAPGLDGRGDPLETVEAIAAHQLAALDREGVRGPYLLAGHSFGGFVAFEMARQVRIRGEQVALVALLDSVGVAWSDAQLPLDEGWVASELARVLFYTVGERHPDLTFAELEVMAPFERVLRLVGHGADSELARPLARRLLAVMKANLEAMVRYRVSDYRGEMHLFRAREPLDGVLSGQFTYGSERDLGWHAASGAQVIVHDVPGNHFSMMGEPHVRSLAGALSRVLGLAREAAE